MSVYDGPCFDPQCGDSTWDHPCPLPPGDYEVVNGVTRLRQDSRTILAGRTHSWCLCGMPDLPPHDAATHDAMVEIERKGTRGR